MLPLRYRLPNPPAVFVGRETETEQLAAAVTRAPVSVVWGLGGLGKTALVLNLVHRRFPRQARRTVFVAVRTGDPSEQVLLEVARALALARGVDQGGWETLLTDLDALAAAAIDLAEEERFWIVLDDLHHATAEGMSELLGRLARYARESRWIMTSRIDPRLDELSGQVLPLGALLERDLIEIAHQCAPSLGAEDLRQAVDLSAGSPWRFRLALSGRAGKEDYLLRDLPGAAARLLEDLVIVDAPLAVEAIRRFAGAVAPADLEELERWGLLERSEAGWRLHDVARPLLQKAEDSGVAQVRVRRIADALADAEDPVACLEALRLWLDSGRSAEAADLLARRGEEWFAAGYAPRIWQALAPQSDARLARWRLRCAAELGDRVALSEVREPEEGALQDRLWWARALFVAGLYAEAAKVSAEVSEQALSTGERALSFRAGLMALEARCAGGLGRREELKKSLEALRAAGPEEGARRNAYAALSFGLFADYDLALAAAAEATSQLPRLDPATRREVCAQLVAMQVSLGRIREAEQMLETLAARGVSGSLALYHSRSLLFWRAAVAICAGRLDEARTLLARYEPFLSRSLRPVAILLDLYVRVVAGDLPRVAEMTELLIEGAAAAGNEYFHQSGLILRAELAVLRAQPLDLPSEEPPQTMNGELLALCRQLYEIRWGRDAGPVALPPATVANHAFARIVKAQHALVRDELEEARREINAAVNAASDLGHRLYEAEARHARCEILLVAGRAQELRRAAEDLAELGVAFPSARHAAEAQFFRMAAEDVRPALLEELASLGEVAPIAARRSQALLGATAHLDAVDGRVVGVLRRGFEVRPVRAVEGRGWGLDGRRREIWLPDGRSVTLTSTPLLWRTLEAIAARGGSITKEELARSLWGTGEYHPLRHDNRLQKTVSRLRQLIEADPAAPERLVTTEGGYAFGDREPVRWLRASS